ncbi:hypothetical protein AR687_02590 [Flavobacteriaceae bacterium CRH]|nr:hypothetical protein AR687_02590 [Flavobacteriaceae bacterium CRH]
MPKKLFNTLMTRILFKNISLFDVPEFTFTISFPKYLWTYRKVSKNQFWFVNKKNNQAIILEYFNDTIYNDDMIKNELNHVYTLSTIGDFTSFLKCKNFKEYSTLEYEWIIIDSGMKIIFSCSILDNKSEEQKANDYNEAYSILNTLKISSSEDCNNSIIR